MKSKFSKDRLLRLAMAHKDSFTSVNAWNAYSKENGLPGAGTYVNVFGSWNAAKKELGLSTNKQFRPQLYTDEELYLVLEQHKDHYTSPSHWNTYAKKNNLPTHGVFSKRLGDDVVMQRTGQIWRKREGDNSIDYAAIMREHYPEKPPTVREWADYARTHKLPTSIVYIRKYGSWNKAKRKIYGDI